PRRAVWLPHGRPRPPPPPPPPRPAPARSPVRRASARSGSGAPGRSCTWRRRPARPARPPVFRPAPALRGPPVLWLPLPRRSLRPRHLASKPRADARRDGIRAQEARCRDRSPDLSPIPPAIGTSVHALAQPDQHLLAVPDPDDTRPGEFDLENHVDGDDRHHREA